MKQAFPGFEMQIARLRNSNADFDEICTDFIAIREEFESCSGNGNAGDLEYLSNIKESLSALRKEIVFHLHLATNEHEEEN